MPSEEQRLQAVKLQKKVDGLRRELGKELGRLIDLNDRIRKAHVALAPFPSHSAVYPLLIEETDRLHADKKALVATMEAIAIDIKVTQEKLEELVKNA